MQIVTGREAAALDSSTREIAILEKLAVKQPDNRSWQYDLSRAYNRQGLLLSKLGRSTGALTAYQSGLAIRPGKNNGPCASCAQGRGMELLYPA